MYRVVVRDLTTHCSSADEATSGGVNVEMMDDINQGMIEDGGTESSFSLDDKQSGVEDWTPPNKESSGEELIAPIGGSFE